jgi:hypothetical protein
VTIEGRQNDGEMKERRSPGKTIGDDESGVRAEFDESDERVTRERSQVSTEAPLLSLPNLLCPLNVS